jgi:hypothetical protein
MEFALGMDPKVRDSGPQLASEAGTLKLRVPVSGEGLAQGFTLRLDSSLDLTDWENSGVMLESDTSGPGITGERVYVFPANEPRVFWRHAVTTP